MLTILLLLLLFFTYKIKNKIRLIIILVLISLSLLQIDSFKSRITSVLTTKLDSSNKNRVEIWKRSIKDIIEHPIKGNGFANFKSTNEKKLERLDVSKLTNYEKAAYHYDHSHNSYLELFFGLGIFGLLNYILIYVILIKKLYIKFKLKGNDVYLFAIFSILNFLITGLTEVTIYHRRFNEIVLFIVATVLVSSNFKEEENYDKKSQV